ncbi:MULTISPECIES: LysE family translocator [Alphaproteobacteria]|uniref:Lysine transporter LysE n=2 Tax=Alphaproteobacteria TaxID=28211 RepID=A0A512HED1_9HYPH|nr:MULTISPECIES: LysE family translocator [Alphaproteobacteria]GEO83809.1 lysine transporter LysE [Ciceribacter naphthalenivorans]GLR21313.1 lysine transporter LysE [Ciceribacter naphthalenivorans]GLT04169.1 lysine transporter LysE [Sphingomonas psychrolutea]
MSIETWLAFAAVSVVFLASPNRLTMLVVRYARGQGRKSVLATLPALIFGVLVVMGAALLALTVLDDIVPEILDPVRWVGPAYLLFVLIRLWRSPGSRAPVADNDNLPEDKPLRIMRHAFAASALDRWNYVLAVAVLTQFMPLPAPALDHALWLVGVFLALAVSIWILAALAAPRIHSHMRRRIPKGVTSPRHHPVLIASGSVTAGYRKIAA